MTNAKQQSIHAFGMKLDPDEFFTQKDINALSDTLAHSPVDNSVAHTRGINIMIAANRKEAELNSKRTLAALRKAEDVSEAAYLEAKRAHDISVAELVSFEISNPTPKEFKRNENKLRLRNRGLDI